MPKGTASLIEEIASLPEIANFYLTGGTALSLQLGHRESEDLDFFSFIDFQPELIQQSLLSISPLESVQIERGTLNVFLKGVKLQFLYYPYSLLEVPTLWNNLKLSSVIDIACTKLIAISARGSKKDFIDLYVILEKFPFETLFKKLDDKYEHVQYNHVYILKSLVYFDDAEHQPTPRMHIDYDWELVKQEITKKVKSFSMKYLK